MAKRIRADGTIVCAAMHPAQPGDTYLDDGLSYRLSVDYGVLVTDDQHIPGEGREGHGLWWWWDKVPEGRTPDPFYERRRAALH